MMIKMKTRKKITATGNKSTKGTEHGERGRHKKDKRIGIKGNRQYCLFIDSMRFNDYLIIS